MMIDQDKAIRIVTARAGHSLEENGLLLAIALDLRALPAIGTCKDCGNGTQYTVSPEMFDCPVCGVQHDDFSCAAWRAKA